MLETYTVGDAGAGTPKRQAHVHPFPTASGTHIGLVVLSHPFVETEPSTQFFTNSTFGIAMNQNVAFSGTPEQIHDGIDQTLYTASAVTGSKFTFNQDDQRAYQGIITIVTAADTGGDTTTIGVDGSDTTKTEGVDWNKTDGNNSQTATDLATELSTITGVTATASGAVVTVLADVGVNISKLDTNDATAMPGSGGAVKTDNASLNDVMQFAKGSDLTLANFTALTLRINVDKDWSPSDSIEIYAYDTGLNVEVGCRVKLEDYFTFGDFDIWHSLIIPLTDMEIEGATTVDAFRIRIVNKTGPSPVWYIDRFQLEQSGTPAIFALNNIERQQRFGA